MAFRHDRDSDRIESADDINRRQDRTRSAKGRDASRRAARRAKDSDRFAFIASGMTPAR